MRNYSNTSEETTLAALLNAGALSMSVAAAVGYPAVPFAVVIDPAAATEEVVLVTAAVGTTWTITRGYNGTTDQAHASGVAVRHSVIALDLQEPQDHIANTSNPHSTTAAQVGAQAVNAAAGGVLGGTYPNPSFASDMATQAELDAEAATRASADTTNATNLTTHAGLATSAHGGIVASTDPRLTDSRTPTAHATSHQDGGADELALDGSQVTSGTVAGARLPAASTTAAGIVELATSAETTAGLAVQASDTRLSDSRTPTAHAATHAAAGSDPLTLTQAQITSLVADLAAKLAAASNLSDLANAATARNNLGLGSLAVLSAVTAALISDASANGRSLITAADYAAMRVLLSLVIGTNVQAWDADLDTLAGMGSARAGLLAALPAFIQTVLDDTDAATARGTLVAAPSAATYITQTTNSELSAEQALSSLATGYVKNTTGTGVLTVQAAPIPASDGGALAEGRQRYGGTSQFSLPGVDTYGSVSTATINADALRYETILVTTPITLDQLAIEVTTASGTGGSTARLGIYAADTDWQPSSLIVDGGTVATDSTGVKTVSINQALTPGRYLLVVNASHNFTARFVRGGSRYAGYAPALGASPYNQVMTVTSTYAALPSTVVPWTFTGTSTGTQHFIFCRVSTP